jgi:hypothetical protein
MNASHTHFDAGSSRLVATIYDRASSWLIALLMVAGLAVLVLGASWLSARLPKKDGKPLPPPPPPPPESWAIFQGEGAPLAGKPRLDPVKNNDLSLSDAEDELLKKTLDNAAEAAKSTVSEFDLPPLPDKFGYGIGPGGDQVGPRRPFMDPLQERLRRWEVRFSKGMTLDTYARQLDFFRIELGVLLADGRVAYASNFSKSRPDSRNGEASQESRYYLLWRSGELEEDDRRLLARAGIEAGERPIIKFLPPPLEAQLAALERDFAGESYNRLRFTRFGIRAEGDGFAFYVIEQGFRQ